MPHGAVWDQDPREDLEQILAVTNLIKEWEARLRMGNTILQAAVHLKMINSRRGHDLTEGMRAYFAEQITKLTFSDFRRRWKYLRPMISLQGRLLIEQIFYEIGPPYDALITGFGVVESGGLVYPDDEILPPSTPPGGGGGGPTPPQPMYRGRRKYEER